MREFPGDVLGDRCLHGFGQDAHGKVYALTSERGVPFGTSGAIWRIVQDYPSVGTIPSPAPR